MPTDGSRVDITGQKHTISGIKPVCYCDYWVFCEADMSGSAHITSCFLAFSLVLVDSSHGRVNWNFDPFKEQTGLLKGNYSCTISFKDLL